MEPRTLNLRNKSYSKLTFENGNQPPIIGAVLHMRKETIVA